MTAKKTRNTQVLTARLVITICAIALAFGALFLTTTSVKILHTQWKMVSYFSNIQQAKDQHKYYLEQAGLYPLAGYMQMAEEADARVQSLTDERTDFVANATDPVVRWACRDQAEWLTILAGVVEFIVAVALWCFDACIVLALVSVIKSQKHRQAPHHASVELPKPYRACNNRTIASYRTR